MQPTLDTILSRRSIRKYKPQQVDYEKLLSLVQAGMAAPSAYNQHPWHFVIVQDKNILSKIGSFHPHGKMIPQSAATILLCCDMDQLKSEKFWPQDLSAATQNILLASHAQGLGAVWVGVYPKDDFILQLREICKLPDHIIPFSLIPLGYPDESIPERRLLSEERVHNNFW